MQTKDKEEVIEEVRDKIVEYQQLLDSMYKSLSFLQGAIDDNKYLETERGWTMFTDTYEELRQILEGE